MIFPLNKEKREKKKKKKREEEKEKYGHHDVLGGGEGQDLSDHSDTLQRYCRASNIGDPPQPRLRKNNVSLRCWQRQAGPSRGPNPCRQEAH